MTNIIYKQTCINFEKDIDHSPYGLSVNTVLLNIHSLSSIRRPLLQPQSRPTEKTDKPSFVKKDRPPFVISSYLLRFVPSF